MLYTEVQFSGTPIQKVRTLAMITGYFVKK